jgi:hypothetical protein
MAFQVNGGGSHVKTVDGRRLAKQLKGTTADFRALLAHELVTGETRLCRLSQAQAAKLTCVSRGYVSTVSRASPGQREDIECGLLSVTALHNKPTDAQLDRFVARYGADRVMAALDRATAPSATAANNDDAPAEWWTEVMAAPPRVAAE